MSITQNVAGYLTPYDRETITVSTTAIGFTTSKLQPQASADARDLGKARQVVVSVEGSIRWEMVRAVNPVAGSVGHPNSNGQLEFANWQAMVNFRAVREGAEDATLQVTYLR